jgi:hypothetical protein
LGGRQSWRIALATIGTSVCLLFVVAVFWREDARYTRPTPRPAGLIQPDRGTRLPADRWLGEGLARNGPVLFHFFNPYCPCSRFNLEHVQELRHDYGDRVAFVGVIEAPAMDARDRDDIAARLATLGFDLPYVLDPDGRIAGEAGVYSTPQGVLVDADRSLVYRGNYNVSRYCTDRRTQFVRTALAALVSRLSPLPPDTPAYGCQLPSATHDDGERRWASLGL